MTLPPPSRPSGSVLHHSTHLSGNGDETQPHVIRNTNWDAAARDMGGGRKSQSGADRERMERNIELGASHREEREERGREGRRQGRREGEGGEKEGDTGEREG